MSLPASRSRQVYRVHDEEDLLAAAAEPPTPTDRFRGSPGSDLPGGARGLRSALGEPLPAAPRGASVVRVLLGIGVAVIVFAAIEMHASVGRVTRPAPVRRPGPARAKAGRRPRRSPRARARRAPVAGEREQRTVRIASVRRLARPAVLVRGGGAQGEATPLRAATSAEFGFER